LFQWAQSSVALGLLLATTQCYPWHCSDEFHPRTTDIGNSTIWHLRRRFYSLFDLVVMRKAGVVAIKFPFAEVRAQSLSYDSEPTKHMDVHSPRSDTTLNPCRSYVVTIGHCSSALSGVSYRLPSQAGRNSTLVVVAGPPYHSESIQRNMDKARPGAICRPGEVPLRAGSVLFAIFDAIY